MVFQVGVLFNFHKLKNYEMVFSAGAKAWGDRGMADNLALLGAEEGEGIRLEGWAEDTLGRSCRFAEGQWAGGIVGPREVPLLSSVNKDLCIKNSGISNN